MSVVNFTEQRPSKKVRQVLWSGVKQNDTAQVYDRGQGRYKDIDMSVSGVFGGAAVAPYGRIHSGDDFYQLRDSWGNPISLTATDGIAKIMENPVEIKWVITGGDGTTLVNVALNLIGG